MEQNEHSSINLISESVLKKYFEIVELIAQKKATSIKIEDTVEFGQISSLLSLLVIAGSVSLTKNAGNLEINAVSDLGDNFNKVIGLYLELGIQAIDDWHSTKRINERPVGLSVIEFLENRRLSECKRLGVTPKYAKTIPVSFAFIKGYSKRLKKDVFLFELNKNWDCYNLIGGKHYEPLDHNNPEKTVLREIQEELGVKKHKVRVVALTEKPIQGEGFSRVWAYYPTMLYQAFFEEQFQIGPRNKWFSIDEIEQGKGYSNEKFMYYLENALKTKTIDLNKLPYSFNNPAIDDFSSRSSQIKSFIIEHEVLIGAILTILAALIGIIITVFAK